jgi:hypothetical protein
VAEQLSRVLDNAMRCAIERRGVAARALSAAQA